MPMYDMPAAPQPPPYPNAKGMRPEELDALLAQGYFDGGDGELIPPMPSNPYGAQTPAGPPVGGPAGFSSQGLGNATTPGANAGGGPSSPTPDIQSGIFEGLYKSGAMGPSQFAGIPEGSVIGMPGSVMPPLTGRPQNNETSGPPMGTPFMPAEDPFYLQAQPSPMPGPLPGQGMGPNAPGRRFPRATSLIPGASGSPMLRGRR